MRENKIGLKRISELVNFNKLARYSVLVFPLLLTACWDADTQVIAKSNFIDPFGNTGAYVIKPPKGQASVLIEENGIFVEYDGQPPNGISKRIFGFIPANFSTKNKKHRYLVVSAQAYNKRYSGYSYGFIDEHNAFHLCVLSEKSLAKVKSENELKKRVTKAFKEKHKQKKCTDMGIAKAMPKRNARKLVKQMIEEHKNSTAKMVAGLKAAANSVPKPNKMKELIIGEWSCKKEYSKNAHRMIITTDGTSLFQQSTKIMSMLVRSKWNLAGNDFSTTIIDVSATPIKKHEKIFKREEKTFKNDMKKMLGKTHNTKISVLTPSKLVFTNKTTCERVKQTKPVLNPTKKDLNKLNEEEKRILALIKKKEEQIATDTKKLDAAKKREKQQLTIKEKESNLIKKSKELTELCKKVAALPRKEQIKFEKRCKGVVARNTAKIKEAAARDMVILAATKYLKPAQRVQKLCHSSTSNHCTKLKSNSKYRDTFLAFMDNIDDTRKSNAKDISKLNKSLKKTDSNLQRKQQELAAICKKAPTLPPKKRIKLEKICKSVNSQIEKALQK